jgi:DNA-binding PadR family transcriptional regulator
MTKLSKPHLAKYASNKERFQVSNAEFRLKRRKHNPQRPPAWAPLKNGARLSSDSSRHTDILVDMSEIRDKRRRNDLDLFVLALIESRVSTPYELKTAAGLSPGATIPALTRLIKARFILQEKPGPRGRTDHKITAEGRRYLKSNWQALIDDGPRGDLDADLRVALLALWVGGDRRLAANFLRQSADHRLESADKLKEPTESASLPPLALWYRKMRSMSAQALIKGESAAAVAMAKALPRKPSVKRKQGRSTPKS